MTFRSVDHRVSIYCASSGLVGEWDSHYLRTSPMGLDKFIHRDGVGCARSRPAFSRWKRRWSVFKMLKSIRTPTPRDGVELPIREVPLARCFFPTIQNLKDIVILSILSVHLVCTGTYAVHTTPMSLVYNPTAQLSRCLVRYVHLSNSHSFSSNGWLHRDYCSSTRSLPPTTTAIGYPSLNT